MLPLIEKLHVQGNKISVRIQKELFLHKYVQEHFWCEYPGISDLHEMDRDILITPFLFNIAPVIWVSGKKYRVAINDENIRESLHGLKQQFVRMYPGVSWKGDIVFEQDTSGSDRIMEQAADSSSPVSILFSGGVDSTYTSQQARESEQILITIGGADIPLDNIAGWKDLTSYVSSYALAHGFSFCPVLSNMNRFLYSRRLKTLHRDIPDWWGNVQHGMGLTSMAVPVMAAKGSSLLFIAASHTGQFDVPWGSKPVIDENVRSAHFRVHHHGYEKTRHEKIRYIVSNTQNTNAVTLRVCYSNLRGTGNCCVCEKCIRTISSIIVENKNPSDFGFPVEVRSKVQEIERRFERKAVKFTINLIWIWNDIKNHIDDGTMENCQDENVLRFLKWLKNFSFEKYYKKHKLKYSIRQRYLNTKGMIKSILTQ